MILAMLLNLLDDLGKMGDGVGRGEKRRRGGVFENDTRKNLDLAMKGLKLRIVCFGLEVITSRKLTY